MQKFIFIAAIASLAVLRAAEPAASPGTNTNPGRIQKALYVLKAGGGYNAMFTRPSSSKLQVTVWRKKNGDIRGRFQNDEPAEVLVWNVRVQSRCPGQGTDGQGWETLVDEYPWPKSMDFSQTRGSSFNSSKLAPGQSVEFSISEVTPFPWRLCLIYQVESQPKRQCEAISNELGPTAPWPPRSAAEAYEKIQPGMVRLDVERLLGPPTTPSGTNITWYTYPSASTRKIGILWDQDGIVSKELK